MLNFAVIALLLQVQTPIAVDSISVRGVVRSEQTGAGIPGAKIEAIDAAAGGAADIAGSYALGALTPGAHRLRFSANGYEPLSIDVRLIPGVPLNLDVALAPIPAQLVPVKVLAPVRGEWGDRADASLEPGRWTATGDQVRHSPAFAEGDAFRLLATMPQAHMLPESPASVHVRGGSSDQNLFLLDGAPVLSPVHPSQLLSAFNPDIVSSLVVHGAAPSAQYGGHLSSIINVETPGIPTKVQNRGGLGPTAARNTIELPIIPDRVGLILSGRHTYSGLKNQELAESSMPGTWFDLFGKLSVRTASSEITLGSFAADNALGFPASGGAPGATRNNAFEWATATQYASWRHTGDRTRLELLGWRAHFDGGAVWNPDTVSLGLRSAVRDEGLSAKVGLSHARGQLTAGVQVERLFTSYDVAPADSAGSGVGYLHLLAAPVMTSLFAEESWRPRDRWTMRAGLRANLVAGLAPTLEPRISLGYDTGNRWAFSAGYARLHQYRQSLRGEESLLGTIVGIVLDGYARRLSGVVLPAAPASEPFASRAYVIGSGQAWGLGGYVESRLRRVSLNAGYSFSVVERGTDSLEFRPTFATRQSASLAVGYDASSRVNLHSAFWVASGRPTTILSDDISWDTGAGEVSGSPQHTAGPLNGSRLPFYFRWDLGARYTLPMGRTRAMTAFAGVNNLFNRENKMGYVQPAGTAARRSLTMLPSSVVFGLEWKF
jgi:hypothetical protein